jgi:hypothetical protein
MDSLQNQRWGPALWKLLHSSAERIGSKALKRLPQEESRIWSQLLRSLRFSLPCPQCKQHYQTYSGAYPLSSFSKEEVRIWLYRLHEAVNQRLGKPDTLSLTEVEELYSAPFCFSEAMGVVAGQMRVGIQRGWCAREDVIRTLRYLEEMKRFYDFF